MRRGKRCYDGTAWTDRPGLVTTYHHIIARFLHHDSCCALWLLEGCSSRLSLHNAFPMLLEQSTNTAVCCGNLRHHHGEISNTGAQTISRRDCIDLHNERKKLTYMKQTLTNKSTKIQHDIDNLHTTGTHHSCVQKSLKQPPFH